MERNLTREELWNTLCERHSPEIQEKLAAAHVAIAGLGGLGSNVAFGLARMGVGHLHLIDFDRVDPSNLNRQQYFMRHLGMFKTEALSEELSWINPYLDITTDCVRVTEANIPALFSKEDYICEAFDVPECKAMLVNGVLEHFPDKLLVSASGMAGYGESNQIQTRRVTKNFFLCGDEVSEPGYAHGLMAPRVAICAGHEANLIAEMIIKKNK